MNRALRWQEFKQGPASRPVRHYRYQCLDCGTGSAFISKARISYREQVECSMFDPAIREAWVARQIEERRGQEQAGRDRREEERDEERRFYNDYIRNSPEWKRRRRLVFKRCTGICEGCGERPATEVHHLTYEHLGNEFLWELRGVCRECHERFHGVEPFHPGVEDGAW